MSPRALGRLAIATLVAVLAAGVVVWTDRGGTGDTARGEAFVPNLISKANELTRLRMNGGSWQAEFERRDDGFVDMSGFPVDAQALRAMLTAMATLVIEEPKTADPARHAELELAAPDAGEGAGRSIEAFVGDAPAARLLLGKRDMSVGGTSGGIYARRLDEDQSWLLRGSLDLPPDRAGWFDTALIGLAADRLQSVKLRPADGGAGVDFASAGAGAQLALVSTLPGREADAAKVSALMRLLDDLRFRDVRAASNSAVIDATASFTTQDGSKITIERLTSATASTAASEADGRWVRVSAVAREGDPDAAIIGGLHERVQGFDFMLEPAQIEAMATSVEDWLQPLASPAPSQAPGSHAIPGLMQAPATKPSP